MYNEITVKDLTIHWGFFNCRWNC